MEDILEMLQTIGDFFVMLIDFVIMLVEDLAYLIKLTGEFVIGIPSYFSWLPGGIISIIVMVFAIVVIYKVLGREG